MSAAKHREYTPTELALLKTQDQLIDALAEIRYLCQGAVHRAGLSDAEKLAKIQNETVKGLKRAGVEVNEEAA